MKEILNTDLDKISGGKKQIFFITTLAYRLGSGHLIKTVRGNRIRIMN